MLQAKEEKENEKTRRRKESTAKYQQWLIDKERLAFEKEMQEIEQLKKRKISTAPAKGNTTTSRKISSMKKTK